MEHLTKIVGEYLTEPNSKVKAEDLVWTERDISISQKIMTGLSGQFFCTIIIKVYFLWLQVDKDLDVNVMNFLPVRSFVF